MNIHFFNNTYTHFYHPQVYSRYAMDQYYNFILQFQIDTSFNFRVNSIKEQIKWIDNVGSIPSHYVRELVDFVKSFIRTGAEVKKNLTDYREKILKVIRETINDVDITQHQEIIQEKMIIPQWTLEKKEFCIINTDKGLFNLIKPWIITEIANKERLDFLENELALVEQTIHNTLVILDILSEITTILSRAVDNEPALVLNLRLRSAEKNWNYILALSDRF